MKAYRTLFISALVLGAVLASVPAFAQVTIEGPITNVLARAIVVMGVRIQVPAGVPIVSPTGSLTLADVGAAPPLPGRTTNGFLGGTAIVNGRINATTGVITATDVFVEPAENVLVGRVTAATCTNQNCGGAGNTISILGRRLFRLQDPRMPSGNITNDFLFEADMTGVGSVGGPNLVGRLASAEGYFASNRLFYHTLEITGAPLLRPGVREVSILRAQCRAGSDFQVDGFVHNPPNGVVTVVGAGDTTATVAQGVFGIYRFQDPTPPAQCPTEVTVQFGNATATAPVDIIP